MNYDLLSVYFYMNGILTLPKHILLKIIGRSYTRTHSKALSAVSTSFRDFVKPIAKALVNGKHISDLLYCSPQMCNLVGPDGLSFVLKYIATEQLNICFTCAPTTAPIDKIRARKSFETTCRSGTLIGVKWMTRTFKEQLHGRFTRQTVARYALYGDNVDVFKYVTRKEQIDREKWIEYANIAASRDCIKIIKYIEREQQITKRELADKCINHAISGSAKRVITYFADMKPRIDIHSIIYLVDYEEVGLLNFLAKCGLISAKFVKKITM